jgi:hypothetical protein
MTGVFSNVSMPSGSHLVRSDQIDYSWSPPAVILGSMPFKIHDHFFFIWWWLGSVPLSTPIQVGSGKLLHVLASTITLGSRFHRTRPYFFVIIWSVGQVNICWSLASTVILGSQSCWTYDHVLLSHDSGSCASLSPTVWLVGLSELLLVLPA